jgi:hypothetical protein
MGSWLMRNVAKTPNPHISTTTVANIAAINSRKLGSIRPRWTPRAIPANTRHIEQQVIAEAWACPEKACPERDPE